MSSGMKEIYKRILLYNENNTFLHFKNDCYCCGCNLTISLKKYIKGFNDLFGLA